MFALPYVLRRTGFEVDSKDATSAATRDFKTPEPELRAPADPESENDRLACFEFPLFVGLLDQHPAPRTPAVNLVSLALEALRVGTLSASHPDQCARFLAQHETRARSVAFAPALCLAFVRGSPRRWRWSFAGPGRL